MRIGLMAAITVGLVFLIGAFGWITFKALLTRKPFDYKRVTYWSMAVVFGAAVLMPAFAWADEGDDLEITLGSALAYIGFSFALILVTGGLMYVPLRLVSNAFAKREQQLAEQQERRHPHENM